MFSILTSNLDYRLPLNRLRNHECFHISEKLFHVTECTEQVSENYEYIKKLLQEVKFECL